MSIVPIIYKNANLEILTKLLNSVAKKYGCRVKYVAEEDRIVFSGGMECCRHVTEETLALLSSTMQGSDFKFNCPTDVTHDDTNTANHI